MRRLPFRSSTLSVFVALSASAQSRADGRDAACNERHATALGQVACEIARALPRDGAVLQVGVRELGIAASGERKADLARRLASAVAGELGKDARLRDPVLDAQTSARSAMPHADVVVLSATLERDGFSASAELIKAPAHFWDRFRSGEPGASARAAARRPLDAELKSYLPPVPLVLSRIDKARLDEPSVALACGDVDGDGALEIVSVGRHRVQLGRVEKGNFTAFASKPWQELSDVAPHPLREPLASAVVTAPGALDIGLSDRADALRLGAGLTVLARYAGQMPWSGGGCARFAAHALADERAACVAALKASAAAPALDAVAGARIVRRDGSAAEVFARRKLDGRLELEQGSRRVVLEAGVGAQIALGDLDGDGRAELVASLDTLDPASDAIVVRTLLDDGKLREAFRVPVPSGVRALALCPSEGALLTPIVAATGDGLWILR